MKSVLCIAAAALGAALIAPAAEAKKPELVNLTKVGNKVADGNAACPETSYFLYSGGFDDFYAGSPEAGYPSPGMLAYFDLFPTVPVASYDTLINNAFWGDSFYLQKSRSICHAIVQFRVKPTGDIQNNEVLSMVHFDPADGSYEKIAAVFNPGYQTGLQSYALDAAGLTALGNVTASPTGAIFDAVMEDDTSIDFFRLYVWYGN